MTFSTEQGRRVLKHLMDTIYCAIYEGSDPIALATLNGRRSVVHEILENIDVAERPNEYRIITEDTHGRMVGPTT